jgi:hypothetical protein
VSCSKHCPAEMAGPWSAAPPAGECGCTFGAPALPQLLSRNSRTSVEENRGSTRGADAPRWSRGSLIEADARLNTARQSLAPSHAVRRASQLLACPLTSRVGGTSSRGSDRSHLRSRQVPALNASAHERLVRGSSHPAPCPAPCPPLVLPLGAGPLTPTEAGDSLGGDPNSGALTVREFDAGSFECLLECIHGGFLGISTVFDPRNCVCSNANPFSGGRVGKNLTRPSNYVFWWRRVEVGSGPKPAPAPVFLGD